jgi:hypothetical protein
MPDTLRLVAHELAAFLPAHEPGEAELVITAIALKQRGRRRANAPTPAPPRRFDVSIAVQARGWRAVVRTSENVYGEHKRKPEDPLPSPGEWTEPMAAMIVDLAAKSPLPLVHIALVESEKLTVLSRRATMQGVILESDDDLDRAMDVLENLWAADKGKEIVRVAGKVLAEKAKALGLEDDD